MPTEEFKKETVTIRDLKKMRLARHWSQEQLATMSGLSIRTIQRIENGENAGLESLKALAAVFETTITDAKKEADLTQVKKEAAYIEKVKGLYKLIAIAVLSLALPIILVINDVANLPLLLWTSLSWILVIGIYSLNSFDFFGEAWKHKLLEKKFGKE
ncbi:helix-turn-helix transcriptional regulator [uncultured Tenacibaculum sp.]|uniref:helix-turn-helix domain-containing protein n=1 Tax=uncultured Tenacibaculum sp. TaxID=174713 RepID=UPI002628DA2E|nr:helix-turn-helix transcriptional regulator [uncultured Tenacibaculum sp.]